MGNHVLHPLSDYSITWATVVADALTSNPYWLDYGSIVLHGYHFTAIKQQYVLEKSGGRQHVGFFVMVGFTVWFQFSIFQFNLKQIHCPTKYRIQHHGCDYMTQITTGKISKNIHTYTYVYTVTYMLNRCPTLNQMLGDIHFRSHENEHGNVLDQFHWSLVQCVTRNGCHSKWIAQTDKTT